MTSVWLLFVWLEMTMGSEKCGSREASATLQAHLLGKGWVVERGAFGYSPFGITSNPQGTYGQYKFSPLDDDFCDCITYNNVSSRCQSLGHVNRNLTTFSPETMCGGGYLLGPEDAVVFLGCLPPPSRYFALQTNVVARFENDSNVGPGVWYPEASGGDAVNQLVFPVGWGELGVMVTTANPEAAQSVREVFADAVVEVLDASATKFWNGADFGTSEFWDSPPDILKTVGRITMPIDQESADEYVNSVYARGLLLRRPPAKAPPAFLEPKPLRPRKDDVSAWTYAQSVQRLAERVAEGVGRQPIFVRNMSIGIYVDDPKSTALNYTFMKGSQVSTHYMTRDAYYAQASAEGEGSGKQVVPFDSLVVVVGTSSTNFFNTSQYDNVAFSADDLDCFANMTRVKCTPTHDFETARGSAALFDDEQSADDGALFAVAWARESVRPCSMTPWAALARACIDVPDHIVKVGANVSVWYRAYLNPKSKVGANKDDMLPPTILAF